MHFPTSCITVLLTLLILPTSSWNPYEILGVEQNADSSTIKKAYKQRAKEWHPDKNSAPDAEEKFVEIKTAYEVLSDPERRRNYDNTGRTEETPNFRQPPRGHPFSPDDLLHHFAFRRHGTMLFHKQSITLRQYENKVLPSSRTSPTLLLAFSEWCFSCVQMEPVWATLSEELGNVGIGVSTVHAEHERELAGRLSVDSLPRVFLVLDGRVVRYPRDEFSFALVIDFIRSKMSPGLFTSLTPSNADTFLAGWTDNRVRLVLFSQRPEPRLRYITLAYKFRASAAAAYVPTLSADSAPLLATYGVPARAETLLVLKEAPNAPAATLSMDQLPFNTMVDVVEKNRFLVLPRLSSQSVLDTLCPTEASRARRHLCAVLVARSGDPQTARQAALREHVWTARLTSPRLRYAYIYMDKQAKFLDNLLKESSPEDPVGHVLILWRQDSKRVQYDWTEDQWETKPDRVNQSVRRLEDRLRLLLTSTELLPHQTTVQELVDEHAHPLLRRIASRLYHLWEYVLDRLSRDEVVPAVSVVATIVFLIAGGYLMAYLVKMEEESIQSRYRAEGRTPPTRSGTGTAQLRVHEMRVETYNGLVRLLKPGCRTIVLLVDADSKANLLARFHRIVWPYRKNKSLMFAFVVLERGLEWYRRLLMPSLPDNQQLNINPKNCIGTVLSINGYRKYFCMYHAKHAEVGGKAGARRRRTAKGGATGGGEFLGFDEDDSSSSDVETGEKREHRTARAALSDEVLFEEHLLDGLGGWLDRLFEGQTVRYHVKYWPDFTGK
ncbi:dnaJ homolog subfamily C member 16-like [Amphibalanus amphitrite]|uniref:dnaJ homolog subfamily C member 16-like n=1 Tax=Amphibalanus amphitrite TaxID=1232801 RepID=UPI001C9208D6|nr:dnaJ homolog subfamily C member 16-like [Amphibalanus amphitrite]